MGSRGSCYFGDGRIDKNQGMNLCNIFIENLLTNGGGKKCIMKSE